jgi:PPIC-type PPIASE domain
MIRKILMMCAVAASCLLAQQPPVQKAPTSAAPQPQPPIQPPKPVAPEATVITIHGLCPTGSPPIGHKSDSCTVLLTRAELETMVAAINFTNQNYPPAAMRSLASGYITMMALADAGEKAGIEKDPRFADVMKVARTRALAEAYRRSLQEKYGNPPDTEIEAYYKQNMDKFEQTKVDRILVPKVNPLNSQDKPAEFEKKARELADKLRERAAHGEDIITLQSEAYKTLSLRAMPPQTELNETQKRTLQSGVKQDVNALKAGEVTKVETEASGFTIYKMRAKSTLTLDQARPQIVHDLLQKNMDIALRAATDGVHSEFNEQFFKPQTGMIPTNRLQPRVLAPGAATGRPIPSNPAAQPK